LSSRYDSISRIWESRGNKRYAIDLTQKALDVFNTCFGPDFQTTRDQVSRLEKMELMAD
jgi:hypothetical protein